MKQMKPNQPKFISHSIFKRLNFGKKRDSKYKFLRPKVPLAIDEKYPSSLHKIKINQL
jgi:hypothetical protein